MIELELLAVCWAITKCRVFLAGLQHFYVTTDHNPLIPILNTRHLDEVENPRLQRLKSRLMGYHFTAQWTKGSSHSAPDALSRNPVSNPHTEDSLAEYDSQHNPEISTAEIRAVSASSEPLVTTRLQELREKAANDPEYQQLREIILNGFPDHRQQLPEPCRRFVPSDHNITTNILSHFGTRYPVVRWGTTVYSSRIQKLCHSVGFHTQNILTKIPTEQWQDRGHSKINEEDSCSFLGPQTF